MVFFLIGFMGSGKTHWGKAWAKASDLNFVDLDEEIEKLEGRTINDIFETNGETYFRDLETKTLKNIILQNGAIISCGGGTPCYNDNLQWMNENGTTVYLKATPALLAERLLNEKDRRPLIKDIQNDQLPRFIEQKLRGRELFFNKAKIIVDARETNINTFLTISNPSTFSN